MTQAIVMPASGRAELQAVAGDGPLADDEIAGATLASVISPGTELGMQFLAAEGFPHRPGYGAVFRVDAIGASVHDVAFGDRFFCIGPHASRQRCRRGEAVPVPVGADPVLAAVARLLAIAWAAVGLTRVRPPAWTMVLGCGPIGHLCARLFRANGYRVLAVEPRADRRRLLAADAELVVADTVPGADGFWQDRCRLVVDCSGRAEAVYQACCRVAKGGEILLVGVPWDRQPEPPARDLLWKIFWRHLDLRSGWEWTLPWEEQIGQPSCHRAGCEAALTALADGRLAIAELVDVVAPDDCQKVYDVLCGGGLRDKLFTVFDWSSVPRL